MFPSLSQTVPNSQVTTSFKTSQTITIIPETPFAILVNGVLSPDQTTVTAYAGDVITAEVTTPADYVWHDFYYYSINGVTSSFAVVNKSLFTIHVKPKDALLRWYLYSVSTHTLTYRSNSGISIPLKLGSKFDVIDADVHVVLDPNSESVYFYNNFGIQLSKVQLPAAPLAYVKIPEKKTVVVLVFGGESYEIYLDSSKYGIAPLFARRNYSEFTDTTFVTQLPGEDIISYLRRARSRKTIPPATCLCYNGKHIWAGGNGSIWKVDPFNNFWLLNVYDIDEYVLNITPLPNFNGAVVVCQSQAVYTIDDNGVLTKIYQGTAVWEPALFNGKIFIPESEIGYFKVYNPDTQQLENDIALNEFSPSYTTVVNNKMYVCGHDTEKVLVFDTALNQTELVFPAKVTWVSVVNDTYIVSHWLKDYKVLDNRDLYRIVNIGFRNRSGPITHIGTDENLVMTLGSNEVYAHTPRDSWLWLNGKRTYSNDLRGTALIDGDYIAMNFSAKVAGASRTNCVIGDTAYDYDTVAYTETYFPRFIDLPINRPQNQGIFTSTIVLPKYFSPTRLSIEFGSIKVNDSYYYGDEVVNANDKVEIEINTRGNSALPVFTIGARQFVIPISTNITPIAPLVSEKNQLDPGVEVEYEIVIGVEGSKVDYIIPGYYDILVTKNDTNITGNYYQQFGKGDILKVKFLSSQKKYDNRNVYILGGVTNYEFRANNKLPIHIDYLDYGVLVNPNVRYAQNQIINNLVALSLFTVTYYEETSDLYKTNELTISGLDPNTVGNITISGKNAYFILNGGLITTSPTIQVTNGDTLALAREVVSYFENPVYLTQTIPSGDEDGYFEFAVGNWGITNRTINNAELFSKFIQIELPIQYENKKTNVDLVPVNSNEIEKSPVRKVFFHKEVIDTRSKILATETIAELTTSKNSQVSNDTNTVSLLKPTQRNVFSATEVLFNSNKSISEPYIMVNDVEIQPVIESYVLTNQFDNILITSDTNTVSLLKPTQRNVFSSIEEFVNNTQHAVELYAFNNYIDNILITSDTNTVSLLKPTQRTGFSSVEEFVNSTSFITEPYVLTNQTDNILITSDTNTVSLLKPTQRNVFSLETVQYNENWYITEPYVLTNQTDNILITSDTNTVSLLKPTQRNVFSSTEEFDSDIQCITKIYAPKVFNNSVINTVNDGGYATLTNPMSYIMDSMAVQLPTENTFSIKLLHDIISETSNILNSGYKPIGYVNKDTLIENSGIFSVTISDVVTASNKPEYNLINVNAIGAGELSKHLTNLHSNKLVDFKFPVNTLLPSTNVYLDIKNTVLPNINLYMYIINKMVSSKYTHEYTKDKVKPAKHGLFYTPVKTNFYKFISHKYFPSLVVGVPSLISKYIDVGTIMDDLIKPESRYKNYNFDRNIPLTDKKQEIIGKLNATVDNLKRVHHIYAVPFNLFRTAKWFSILRTTLESVNYIIKKTVFNNPRIHWITPEKTLVDPSRSNWVKLPLIPITTLTNWVNAATPKTLLDTDLYYFNKSLDIDIFNKFVNYYILLSSGVKHDRTGIIENDHDNFVKMGYIRRNDNINTQNSNTSYTHIPLSYQLDGTISEREIFPILGLDKVNASQYRQSQSDYSKYVWLRERPQYYYGTDSTEPEFNQGMLWDHNIETTYGAFLTVTDAVEAATKYQEFNPYLIFNTNLWTYRVIIDSNLVCPIRVRYPIAWLIRGG